MYTLQSSTIGEGTYGSVAIGVHNSTKAQRAVKRLVFERALKVLKDDVKLMSHVPKGRHTAWDIWEMNGSHGHVASMS